jgi:hypothetical protein
MVPHSEDGRADPEGVGMSSSGRKVSFPTSKSCTVIEGAVTSRPLGRPSRAPALGTIEIGRAGRKVDGSCRSEGALGILRSEYEPPDFTRLLEVCSL